MFLSMFACGLKLFLIYAGIPNARNPARGRGAKNGSQKITRGGGVLINCANLTGHNYFSKK
jgi:hypothetical protein